MALPARGTNCIQSRRPLSGKAVENDQRSFGTMRCIDIGKKFLVACIMVGPADSEPRTEVRKFGTSVVDADLKEQQFCRF
jgi:hypothetical protein